MDFGQAITAAAAAFESGDLAGAAEAFKRLCEDETIGAGGRAIAAVNLAVTYDKMGHVDHAVASHEYGASVVTSDYAFAQENRAAYLHKIGRVDDAIAIWRHLLDLEFLPQNRIDALRHNLAVAGG
jgi:tetratricopeptide (TPR) repeat protein